ncbi:uncharacterized protein I206_100038 [Kwoniella pini CBS 10737]|uniref:Uncharacterized protein n=1 Tax=Kwoniella pini CBS 10737 TaxID=1296096 RepID=A0A1B9HSD0_9TREE|nr:uncharacterized protein I206_07853 [Kwoniella pini CBS 10737]OCF46183.1 hypothetical protein I206_07853 [Kwoniella pini CBS 10737]
MTQSQITKEESNGTTLELPSLKTISENLKGCLHNFRKAINSSDEPLTGEGLDEIYGSVSYALSNTQGALAEWFEKRACAVKLSRKALTQIAHHKVAFEASQYESLKDDTHFENMCIEDITLQSGCDDKVSNEITKWLINLDIFN